MFLKAVSVISDVQSISVYSLMHGCARVAHCVPARWRNFSHYCRPLRHYDVWLRVLITEKHWQPGRQHTVHRNKRLEFATEQVGKLRYVTAVDGGLKRFPWVAWFAHPWPNVIIRVLICCFCLLDVTITLINLYLRVRTSEIYKFYSSWAIDLKFTLTQCR